MANIEFDSPYGPNNSLVFNNPYGSVAIEPEWPGLDGDFLAWLKNPLAIRIVIIEAVALVNGVETTRYMSNKGWKSGPNDIPPNTHYEPIAKSGVDFSEQLSLTAQASLSAGDIEIDNFNGERESWLDDVWTGRTVKAWIGDPRWSLAQFKANPIFNGVMAPIARKSDTKLALKLRDKSKQLDAAMTEDKLGGTGQNADTILPICLGENHNITPLLINSALLQYMVHNGPYEGTFEVRVNDTPVAYTDDPSTGTFKLLRQPTGTVTCSSWGAKFNGIYNNTVASLVKHVVTRYGKDTDRFTDADLDLASLATFEINNPQAVGIFIAERMNVLNVVQQLASSVGAQMTMSRLGLMRLVKVDIPAVGTVRNVYQHEFVAGTLLPTGDNIAPVAAKKLGYCKNWTVQKNLSSDIPAEHIALFATEYLTVSAVDEVIKLRHKLSGEAVEVDTLLLDIDEAQAECDRRLMFEKVARIPYEGTGYPELLELYLGQPIIVYNDDYSMTEGVEAIVMRLTPDWDDCKVKVGFLV